MGDAPRRELAAEGPGGAGVAADVEGQGDPAFLDRHERIQV